MFLAFKLSDIVTVPFGWLLGFLYEATSNYGVAMIIFAVIVQLVILPIITPKREVVEDLEQTERGEGGFGSTGP